MKIDHRRRNRRDGASAPSEAPDSATIAEISAAARELETATPQQILAWAARRYQPGLALACSFGGPSGMVLLDMVMAIDRAVEVFYLDTDFLFPETHKLRDVASARYRFEPVGYMSLLTPRQQAQRHGDELWARDPDACCAIRKVEPNQRALAGKQAWISGIRRDQTKQRAARPVVEWDEKFGLVKVNPLVTWTEAQVWKYVVENGVPYNELHDRSYPSIGCTYCTKPVRPGDDPRSGRWQGQDKVECGLHVPVGATGIPQEVAGD